MTEISTAEGIRELVGEPNPNARKKIYSSLNSRMREFIATSPLLMVSSVDELGFSTISPKGDKAGFVKIHDENTLLIPELCGNKLAFSLQNIVTTNSKVGLIFMRPGTIETLRVHGECSLVAGDICDEVAGSTHRALLVLKVTVNNAYFHCGKALLRSQAWQEATHLPAMKIPFGKGISENDQSDASMNDDFIAQTDEDVQGRYKTDL